MTTAAQGFLTGLALIVAIGAQNVFVLRQGILREHVLLVVTVCSVADAALIGLGIAGTGAAIESHPGLLALARYGGATFLLAFAVKAFLRARRPAALEPGGEAPAGRASVLLACLGITLLNPHVYLDTVVLLGGIAAQHGGTGRWIFGAGAVSASIAWFAALGFGASGLRPFFARPRSWRVLDAAIGVSMTGLALVLVA